MSSSSSKSGKVYIASMNMRGSWAERPSNTSILNVTSMQAKNKQERIDFSPMSEIEGGYKGYFCFENYWQSGKVFDGVDSKVVKNYWQTLKTGKRRYPGSKHKKVLHSNYDGTIRDYITSRKEIYVPEYFVHMIKSKSFQKWKTLLEQGTSIVVYDFDGPRKSDFTPDCQEITLDFLKEKINFANHPFGHGYVVAAALCGYKPEDYTK